MSIPTKEDHVTYRSWDDLFKERRVCSVTFRYGEGGFIRRRVIISVANTELVVSKDLYVMIVSEQVWQKRQIALCRGNQ